VYGRAPQVGLRAPGYQPQDSRAAYAVARHRPAPRPVRSGAARRLRDSAARHPERGRAAGGDGATRSALWGTRRRVRSR